ncbi:NUMOD4 domain-containing protein [Mycobacterium sherrisii]|uniref:NUMOD4 domain-containing protein n=1 Tax=Mycobacterium sherrisii TaxID=243061 RepID=UPI002DDCB8B2|nr:NUMOD4 domain-containing protein [Mycobacterium sherrisii]MEC4763792.1 NUMOD4 domain-containing protein [Mycobacterium sherrisii]
MTEERWLPVVGYEGLYEVSDLGRVKSLARTVIQTLGDGTLYRRRLLPERILKQTQRKGYMRIALWRDGRHKTFSVHTLVLTAFVGPRPPGQECCHLLEKTNNELQNILWDTPTANTHDQLITGVHSGGATLTHCARGHEYTPDNTYINPTSGHRQCQECRRASHRQRRAAKRKAIGGNHF